MIYSLRKLEISIKDILEEFVNSLHNTDDISGQMNLEASLQKFVLNCLFYL